MGGGSLIWFLIIAVAIVVPFWKLLPRFGISKYFALLAVLPAIALVLLWIMAFKDDIDGSAE
ncbi:hypothetical protein GQ651_07945 [Alphaproteobacteria bacterium GH1-50]|uniref:Uncharacterized protein n=1 Tax=Kangsaoukella pontilimi TaxID=2691042 RepID=A0A7C9MFI2_9RHOB|nr:hypothetical protein [Kangsaoukella pontilimi]MXQ07776.1 hypothetical protein [Kangsaoukella pontilimi]